MSIIQKIIDKLKGKKEPPIILTPYGPVTEWARQQAVANMKQNPDIRAIVTQRVIEEMGSVDRGMAEMQRRYPELFT